MVKPSQIDLAGTAHDRDGLARKLAQQPLRPSKPQAPADVGLFSDASARVVDFCWKHVRIG